MVATTRVMNTPRANAWLDAAPVLNEAVRLPISLIPNLLCSSQAFMPSFYCVALGLLGTFPPHQAGAGREHPKSWSIH